MLLPKLLPPDLATASLRRLRPTATQLAEFKAHLVEMLRHLDPTKIERHSETHILNFLLAATKPAGAGSRYGNVNGKRDLVLHLGETADTPVAVVLEVKGPKNPAEMLTPEDLNRKAFQQLLLYYLEDRSPERTRLQAALFREKRALMEHALFGVDLNPNSVRICRLRLWIELLKHAYYKPETDCRELETLPNLDLNVKAGNSLLARFALDADLSEVFQKGKFSLREYRAAVHQYFGSRGRDDKNTLLGFFQQLKEQFTAVLHKRDKKREALRLARNQRTVLETQVSLLPETKKQEEIRYFELKRLELLAQQLDAEIKTHEQGALFRDAFEWRFEFPEVLDEAGAFRGFDVVIGNPPYILPRLNFHSISGAFTTSVAGQLEVPNKRKLQRVGLLHLQRSRFNTIG